MGATSGATAINRRFYDALWASSYIVEPERFNTWPLLSSLSAGAPSRLEIGAGLHPRLPIAGTHFVDLSAAAVARLRARGGLATRADITALPFPDAAFELICAFDIVEHVEDDARVFRELARIAADGATAVLSLPLHAARWTGFDRVVGHVRRYDSEALPALLAAHGFDVERSAGFGMAPRSGRLLDLGVWALTHRWVQAMRCYNRVLLPLGLLLQRPVAWQAGLIDLARVDEVVAVCRRRSRS